MLEYITWIFIAVAVVVVAGIVYLIHSDSQIIVSLAERVRSLELDVKRHERRLQTLQPEERDVFTLGEREEHPPELRPEDRES